MKELTKREVCRLLSAIREVGLNESQWVDADICCVWNARDVFGTDDDSIELEPGWYVAVYTSEDDDLPIFQNLMADVITDNEKCVLLDTNVLIFCAYKRPW